MVLPISPEFLTAAASLVGAARGGGGGAKQAVTTQIDNTLAQFTQVSASVNPGIQVAISSPGLTQAPYGASSGSIPGTTITGATQRADTQQPDYRPITLSPLGSLLPSGGQALPAYTAGYGPAPLYERPIAYSGASASNGTGDALSDALGSPWLLIAGAAVLLFVVLRKGKGRK